MLKISCIVALAAVLGLLAAAVPSSRVEAQSCNPAVQSCG
jgi:hypothetical protein